MIKKTLLFIMDGLGDRPVQELGNRTPLEAAYTPNFNKIVKKSQCGSMYTLGIGKKPGSDTAHLTIFGYPIEQYYYGRGPIEAVGAGIELEEGDVAFRGNFGTVDQEWNVIDRRAGRIEDCSIYANALDGMEIDGIKFIIKPGSAYRAGVVMRGQGLSANVTPVDSHMAGDKVHAVTPLDDSKEATFTANVLNKFVKQAYDILNNLEANKQREKNGQLKANFLLLRGSGIYSHVPPFTDRWGFNKACCVAGGGLYKGVSKYVGMDIIDVPGANAQVNTNIEGKVKAAVTALAKYDFVFLHIKPTDSLAEDGNYMGKKEFIEKIDKYIAPLTHLDDETLLVITADHSTACELKTHSADPVPILFCAKGIRSDSLNKFGERECAKGSLGVIEGKDVMPNIQNIMGKLPLIGA